jgi:phenylpropionate dioxygenase-like ring-hydroxylating dioxygenase large terminal subunit
MHIEVAGEFAPAWRNDAFWTGTRAPLQAATGLHPDAYTNPAFFDDEQQAVFERAWVCVGLAADAAPGQLLVRSLGRRSILITRNADGELNGFLNSCRHRGTELYEDDCEVGSTLRCPYHKWGYSLDGALKATPFFDEVPRDEFDPSDTGLVPVRVETWGVLLFACLDERTPPLLDWLGDLPERMAGYGLDDWQPRLTQKLHIDANWKLISENFQEYYHLTWVHPELAKVSRVDDHYRYQGPGMYCGQTTTPVSGDERDDWLSLPPADGLDDSDSVSGRFVAIFPNVLLSVLPNHVFVMQLDPLEPGRTLETCTWLLPKSGADASDEAFEPTRTFWLDVNSEDIDIVQRGQRGLTRGAVPPGPLAPRFEEPLHRFQNILADLMTRSDMHDVRVPDGDDGTDASRLGTGPNPSPAAIDTRA